MSRHREAFEAFAQEAKAELGDDLHRLVLYGSVARGEETAESDVDVFAVVDREDQKDVVRDIAFDTGLEYGVVMSPIVRTQEEFEQISTTMYGREVRTTGVVYV